jgi:hypothetical protein
MWRYLQNNWFDFPSSLEALQVLDLVSIKENPEYAMCMDYKLIQQSLFLHVLKCKNLYSQLLWNHPHNKVLLVNEDIQNESCFNLVACVIQHTSLINSIIKDVNPKLVNTFDMFNKLPLDYALIKLNCVLSDNDSEWFNELVNKTSFDHLEYIKGYSNNPQSKIHHKCITSKVMEYVMHLLDSYPLLPSIIKTKIENYLVQHVRNHLVYNHSLSGKSIFMLLIKHRCQVSVIKTLIVNCNEISKLNHIDSSGHNLPWYITNSTFDDSDKEILMKAYNEKLSKYVELDKCPICHDSMFQNIDIMHLQCRHIFHSSCFLYSLQRRPNNNDAIKCLVCMNNVHSF